MRTHHTTRLALSAFIINQATGKSSAHSNQHATTQEAPGFVRDDMIISCCREENKIRSWSLEGGPFHVYGTKGNGAGQFDYPRLCDVDREHTMLVADSHIHRIQAVSSQGEGCALRLDSGIKCPRGAVIFKDKLVVVSDSPHLFTVFSHV